MTKSECLGGSAVWTGGSLASVVQKCSKFGNNEMKLKRSYWSKYKAKGATEHTAMVTWLR